MNKRDFLQTAALGLGTVTCSLTAVPTEWK
jgi:hypothetical protein